MALRRLSDLLQQCQFEQLLQFRGLAVTFVTGHIGLGQQASRIGLCRWIQRQHDLLQESQFQQLLLRAALAKALVARHIRIAQ